MKSLICFIIILLFIPIVLVFCLIAVVVKVITGYDITKLKISHFLIKNPIEKVLKGIKSEIENPK